MTFVFDTCAFRVLEYYYPEVFPQLWDELSLRAASRELVSVSEVKEEMERSNVYPDFMKTWVAEYKSIFSIPTQDELEFVATIFQVKHFRQLVSNRALKEGTASADAFLIARAKVTGGCVVTMERGKPNSAKIPNVCRHFGVGCMNVRDALTGLRIRL